MRPFARGVLLAGLLTVATVSSSDREPKLTARGAEPAPVQQTPADPTDALDQKLFAPGVGQAAPKPPAAVQDPTARLVEELGGAAIAEELQPVLDIARNMHRAQQRMAQFDSGVQTQQFQLQALSDLERLIAQAAQQSGRSAAKPAAQPSADQAAQPRPAEGRAQPGAKPATGSAQAKKAATEPGPATVQQLLQQSWGELPPRQREQMLQQWGAERFVPKYRALLEAYYQRLAQEKPRSQP